MNWQVGDLAVCVDVEPQPGDWQASPLVLNCTYTVTGLVRGGFRDRCPLGLQLKELAPQVGRLGYLADRFRKILPDKHEDCEPEFVTLLKRSKQTVRA